MPVHACRWRAVAREAARPLQSAHVRRARAQVRVCRRLVRRWLRARVRQRLLQRLLGPRRMHPWLVPLLPRLVRRRLLGHAGAALSALDDAPRRQPVWPRPAGRAGVQLLTGRPKPPKQPARSRHTAAPHGHRTA
eukprot:4233371-Prymnesium_polylepis.1